MSRRLSAGGSKVIFALRARPPCTKTAALFAGTKGILVLIYAKNVQLLVYHTTFSPFVNGKVEQFVPFPGAGRGAPLCGAGMRPHFLWVLPKENGRARSKERRFRAKSAPLAPFCAKRGGVVAGAVQTCRPVPGALYPLGTEMVLRRI